MRKNIIYVITIIALASAFVFLFRFFNQKNNVNGFTRIVKEKNIEFTKLFLLPTSSFYFAGLSPTELYLRDLKNTSALFSIDYSLFGLRRKNLNLHKDSSQTLTVGTIDTMIYVVTNGTGKLSILSKNTDQACRFNGPEMLLLHTCLISKQSIIGESAIFDSKQPRRILVKFNYRSGKIEKRYILEKQVDGFFCTDGMLHFDVTTSKVLFTYFYRGEFLCLDTNLNLLFKSKTIDTVTKAVMKIAETKKMEGRDKMINLTRSAPAKAINRNFIVFQDNLYIMSALKADNESSSDFDANQPVDVYAVKDGIYLYSFYIPKYKGQKLREFTITKEFIFATFHDCIVKYRWSN